MQPEILTVGHSTHEIERQEHTFTPETVVEADRVHYPAQPSLDV